MWQPADPVPKFCPEVIRKYLSIKGTQHPALIVNVRRHLKHLGWTIEYSSSKGVFRYTSPNGNPYLSLSQVCRELGDSVDDVPSEVSHDKVVNIPPQHCPEAVVFWYEHGLEKKNKSNRDMLLKAKMHLLSLGWSFWYTTKGNRRELRYTSPSGAVYISLRTACKACMDEGLDSKGMVSCNKSPSATTSTKHGEDSEVSQTNKKRKKNLMNKNNQPLVDGKLGRPIQDDQKRTAVLRSSKRARSPERFASPSNCKPRTILSWLIDNNGVLPEAKVHYRGRNGPLAKGQIRRDGIKCDCCSKVFTLSGFEAHAGSQKHRPTANIILNEGGKPLLECQKKILCKNRSSTRSQHDSIASDEKQNDEICSICQYGGELVLCDDCPSSFHKSCLVLNDLPKGNWFCPSCCCRICGIGKRKFEEKTEHSVDDVLRICGQCEHNFHVGCIEKSRAINLNNCSQNKWFCSDGCEVISSCLHEILDKPFQLGVDDLTWRLLKSMEVRDHHGPSNSKEMEEALMENQSKLSVALDVMHECFEPIKDVLTERDLVEDVIFNRRSDLNRLNFQGFYTILLERNEEVISVATVRIYDKVAEVPLVATRMKHRRLGMCRVLMNELEKLLIELGVERLVLPAVPGVVDTWTNKFGFSKMTESERLQYSDYTFLDFQDTTMCQKLLRKVPLSALESLLPWKQR